MDVTRPRVECGIQTAQAAGVEGDRARLGPCRTLGGLLEKASQQALGSVSIWGKGHRRNRGRGCCEPGCGDRQAKVCLGSISSRHSRRLFPGPSWLLGGALGAAK